MTEKDYFYEKLLKFFHDPVDKALDIQNHEERTKNYIELYISEEVSKRKVSKFPKASDKVASDMDRALLPDEKIEQDLTEIRHPLSEGSLSVSFKSEEIENIHSELKKIFEKMGDSSRCMDNKKKFFNIWRNLESEIFENISSQTFKKFISVIPAETRTPDHPIWEHIKITSSIDARTENKSLSQNNSILLFSIGPVQSFISQARKTQDFYMGSFILSFLTFKAIEIVVDKFGPTNIIYPDLYKQPLMDHYLKKEINISPSGYIQDSIKIPTIPNRFVALLPVTDESEIRELVDKMIKSIQGTIGKAFEKIFDELNLKNIDHNIYEKITSQLCEFPEVFWVAIPWRNGDKDIIQVGEGYKILEFDKSFETFFNEDTLKGYECIVRFVKQHTQYKDSINIGFFYQLIYTMLEKAMGARKNIRTFKQTQVEERGRKCSVCGERDVIFFREENNKNKFIKFNQNTVDLTDQIGSKYLADGEGLCAVCFLKRTFDIYLSKDVSKVFNRFSFPSTAEVACSDFKMKMLSSETKLYHSYIEKFKEIAGDKNPLTETLPKLKSIKEQDLEGYWLFEENINKEKIKKELGIDIKDEDLGKLKEKYQNLIKSTDDKHNNKPNPYYAVIHLDGDSMGKWLSGENLPEIQYAYNSEVWKKIEETYIDGQITFADKLKKLMPKKLLTPAIHAAISTALRNYSIEFVRKIVEEEHLGKLVYAGGDDVLAFVNLKDLFDVMHKLRWAFSGHIKLKDGQIFVDLTSATGFVEKDGKYLLTMGPRATASMGVVIAHYKTPLQIVIKKAFEMEKLAKTGDKNAFAICLMKRSGEERKAKAKWIYDSQDKDTVELLKKITTYFNNTEDNNRRWNLSSGFIQKVASSFSKLKDENGNLLAESEGIFSAELKRLVSRSINNLPKEKEERKRIILEVAENMEELFFKVSNYNINNFVNLLTITTFTYKQGD